MAIIGFILNFDCPSFNSINLELMKILNQETKDSVNPFFLIPFTFLNSQIEIAVLDYFS